jgi:Lon protease-like protein
MSHDTFDLRSFSGRIPLFPLPNVVLFPGETVALHVFEPRYRQMVEDAASGERLVGMALLRPGWEKAYYGNPAIFGVAGIGRITQIEKLVSDRYNIQLEGMLRGRIVEEETSGSKAYRIARVDPLLDIPGPESVEADERVRLIAAFDRYRSVQLEGAAIGEVDPHAPLGPLAFRLAALTDLDAMRKQRVLEKDGPVARARFLARLLHARARLLGDLRRRLVLPRNVEWN